MSRSFFIVMAALPCLLVAAPAQSAPPSGPYTASCSDARMKGTTLIASCQTAEGKMVPAKLENASRCADGVINLNGILSCQAGTIPPGSYLTSCSDIRILGTTLRASCRDEKGKNIAAELRNANQCMGDIANRSGSLRCVSQGPGSTPTADKGNKPEKKKHRLWPLKRGDKSEAQNKPI